MSVRFPKVPVLPLRWKLLLPFLALSLVTWLVASQMLGDSFQRIIDEQGRADVRQMSSSVARQLEQKMDNLGQQARTLADAGTLMVGSRTMKAAMAEIPAQRLLQTFMANPAGSLDTDVIKVVDEGGTTLLELRRKLLERGALNDQQVLAMARRGKALGTLVTVQGDTVGYLVGASPIDLGGPRLAAFFVGVSLSRRLLEKMGVAGDRDVFIVGPNGILASTGPAADKRALQQAVAGHAPDRLSIAGGQYVVSTTPLDAPLTHDLRVVAVLPTADLVAKAVAARHRAWSILGLGLALFLVVGLWLSATLTRPVRALTLAARQLAGGDLKARAPVRSGDEIGTLAATFNAMGEELSSRAEKLDEAFDELKRLSDTDALTGLLNHRAVHERLRLEIARAQRYQLQLTAIVIDIDNFKLINDTYGHPAGDEVIRQVAAVLAANVRASDIVGRHGGDEFTIILTEIGSSEALTVADKLRGAMQERPMATPDDLNVPIRLSMGMASFPANGTQMNDILAFADANLYTSKRRGGDVVTRGDEEDRLDKFAGGGFSMLDSMVTAVDNKDRYTRRHSEEVTSLALQIADGLGMSEESQCVLRVAGLLHDVGKIGVPDAVLRKPGRLTADEYETVKHHATLGATIIQGIADEDDIRRTVGAHHERWDGAGYPRGTSGRDIPLLGRILAIADAYSAMTSDRPYRQALTEEEALQELRDGAGAQFDAELVSVALGFLDKESLTMPPLLGVAPEESA